MATTTNKPTRRAMLGALALIPAIAAVPALAEAQQPEQVDDPDAYTREEMDREFSTGHKVAMLRVARGWIERWKAAGGSFGLMYNADGTLHCVTRGWAMSYAWTPTDRNHPHLEPHLWLLEEAHQPGAVKALDGLLELVPGLKEAVHEAAGYPLFIDSLRLEG